MANPNKKIKKEINVVLDAQGLKLSKATRKELDAIVDKYSNLMKKIYVRFTREATTVMLRDWIHQEMEDMGVIDGKKNENP